jgi:hypothetical protein
MGIISSTGKQDDFKASRNPSVPTEKDWGNYQSDLDQEYAHRLFSGRTNAEMQPYFRRNPIERTDELRWMPEVPFRYYMLGFRDFVLAGDFESWGADAASCFLGLIEEKPKDQPQYITPVMPELLAAIEHVARNQATYDADEAIYGSFLEAEKRIRALYEDLGSSSLTP